MDDKILKAIVERADEALEFLDLYLRRGFSPALLTAIEEAQARGEALSIAGAMEVAKRDEQEREFKSKLTQLLYQPPTATYASTSGGTTEGIDYYEWMKQILTLIKESLPELAKEAGYRLPTGKAPLLTDEEIANLPQYAVTIGADKPNRSDWRLRARDIAQAQNDADNKHFMGGTG